ncbi:PAS domain S-box protein [Terrimonas alba]|uniref:PAS domain S-box protein n=1 Tax=Terrimonas alba TaxID=3349636 RepID=UPI0035F3E35C
MNQIIEFFKKLLDSTDWPPRWHCGRWTEFHGWLYIISDLLIWTAYFTIPVVIIRYISKKQGIRFVRLYFLFAAFILACGATHFLDAVAFWIPAYRLNALVRLITGVISWVTVFYLVKFLPAVFSLKSQNELEAEIEQRKRAEQQSRESEEQVQTIFNAAPDAVIVINDEGRIIKWNSKSEALFGWKADEVIGAPLSEMIIPPRYREVHKAGLKHFLKTGEGPALGKAIEIQALNKNNVEFDVSLSISPTLVNGKYLFIGFIRDITEKKQAEAQIQKQKQDIQDFIDSMSTLSTKLSTDGKILMVNKIALQASGLSMEELLNTNFLEGQWWTFDPEVHSRVSDAFNKACSGTAINYDENIFVFGQVLTINFSLIPISKTDGSVDYIVAEGRDITAQKKAEEKIKESEEKLSMLFNSMDEGFCIIEMIFDEQKKPVDYRFLVINPSFEKQTGLRDAVGKRMREFAPNHEKHWFETYGRIALTGESIRFENRAEQLHRWYDVYAFRFGEPKNLQVAILFNDITERKQTEETIRQMNLELEKRVEEKTKEVIQNEKRFRTLIENSSEVIIVSDPEGNLIFVSEGIKRMLGYTPQEYMKLNIFNMVSPEEAHSVHQMLQKIVDNPGEPFTINVHIQHRNGSWRWIEAVMAGFLDVPGLDGIVITYRDVTERKEAEDKLMVSENRFRSIIEQFPYPVVTYTADGSYINANEAWEIMWQEKRENVKEYNIRKDPQLINSGLSKYVERAFVGEVAISEPYLYDPKLIGQAGRKRWMQMTLYPLKNADDNILEVILILQDVTENKEAEESLRKSFKEISDYKYALDESSIVAITDQKGIIKYANENFCKISKYNVDELIGQDHRIINSGYHSREFIRNLWVTIGNGKIWKGELKNKAKDDTIYWVDTTIVPFLNEDGKPYQYIAIRTDITERKQAEQALHESKQLLSAIIDNSTAVIYVKDLHGHYLMVNRRFSELFHLNQENILGKTDYDFFSKEEADAFRRLDVRVAEAKHALTEEEIAPHDDGPHTYISVKSTLSDNTGKPYAIFGISTDITERKKVEEAILRAEANYREIFENATDAIYVHEMDTGKIIEVNQRAAEVTGYTKEELLNSDPNDFITGHPDYTLEKALDYIQNAATGKQQLFEWLGKKKDGSFNWFEVNLKKANITGQERILAFFREINDRKKAQLEVQRLNEGLEQKVMERTAQLETVNKELEAFSYSVSHDLRAPLRVIDGYTEIIVSDYGDKLDEEGNRLLGIVTSNVRRMGQLIDDLLNLSRQGRRELNFRQINMAKLVESVIAEQDIPKPDKLITQVGKLEPAFCDNSLIRQVWINLISNAIKYSAGRDNPKIEINSVESGNEIIYSVKDNGVGFNMQYADKLFGVFQRLHKMTEFEGTGVGLALVHRIITRHGGKVWAEAEVDKGATFYFSLPVNTNKLQNN